MGAKTVSTSLLALHGTFHKARITSSHSLIALANQNKNLLDQVGVGLENPHWRGERVILLPLSAFQTFPPFPLTKQSIRRSCVARTVASVQALAAHERRWWPGPYHA